MSLLLRSVVETLWPLKAVEGGGSRHGVRPHVLKHHPLPHGQLREGPTVKDLVYSIAGGAPHTALVQGTGGGGRGKEARNRVGVVEQDAVEGAVHTIIDVVHEPL